jgi:hypothetical protein
VKSRQKSGYAEYQKLLGEHLALLELFLNVYDKMMMVRAG